MPFYALFNLCKLLYLIPLQELCFNSQTRFYIFKTPFWAKIRQWHAPNVAQAFCVCLAGVLRAYTCRPSCGRFCDDERRPAPNLLIGAGHRALFTEKRGRFLHGGDNVNAKGAVFHALAAGNALAGMGYPPASLRQTRIIRRV